jgi:very-short-patch-repair endonuclease
VKSAVLSKHGIFPVMKSEEYLASHDFAVANQKRRKTMLTSGTLWTSKPEMLLGKILIDEFGEDDVLNQVFIGGKSIDFCVKSLRLYVQMDGVYWHGLKTATTNEKIKETIRRDQELNTWFEDQKELKLFRMSDEQLTYVLQYGLIEELINQLKNTVYNLTFFDCKVPYSR